MSRLLDELRSLRRLQREQEPRSPFVFTSERGVPFTTAGFARMLERAGAVAQLPVKAHPHSPKSTHDSAIRLGRRIARRYLIAHQHHARGRG
jgi:site-specific recombinase XerD